MADHASGAASPLVVRGARTHNLKNVDVTLPAERLIVMTGVSGSGKSSLAFDTIYAEGQRRYVESLSAYARQFLERMEKPDVDRIEGISPAIAIRQKNSVRNPRSTVGTTTEIHDYLRLLYARIGRTFCRNCRKEVVRETAEVVARRLTALPARLLIGFDMPIVSMAPMASPADEPELDEADEPVENGQANGGRVNGAGAAEAVRAALENLRKKGFGRVLVDGQAVALDEVDPAVLKDRASLQIIVDRIRIEGPGTRDQGPGTRDQGPGTEELRTRLTDSIETAYLEGGGAAFAIQLVDAPDETTVHRFSERFECRDCGIVYEAPQPRLFSFNNPFGACPTCHGFGNIIELDMDLVVPDPTRSIQQNAIEPWSKPHYRAHLAELKRAARAKGVRIDTPWAALTPDEKLFVMEGDGEYEGVKGFFRWLERKKYKVHVRVFLSRYRGYLTCPECGGARLRREARDVRVGSITIDALCALTVRDADRFFASLELSEKDATIAGKVLLEIRKRLTFLKDVGLDYLTLDRLSSTLSGGESQRISLATSLGSALVGTLYVLDEPSIGLHARDTMRLVDLCHELAQAGNTVVVVEHDRGFIESADHVVELGPGSGERGGEVVFAGPQEEFRKSTRSLTARYLSGRESIALPLARRTGRRQLVLTGAREHNLKDVTLRLPLGT
ncbi:MAG: excinuclease ABC subunit UvrA, partial [Vicinamibacterales bacterium]